jgi:hypothetical protein
MSNDKPQTAKDKLMKVREFLEHNYSLPLMEAHHDGHPMEPCAREAWDALHEAIQDIEQEDGELVAGAYSESLFNALHHGVMKFKDGDRVKVPGAADIFTISAIVDGVEPVAQFKEGGFWRTSELRMANDQN